MRPHSYHTDPSGTYVKYSAKAIGSGSEGAQSSLQEAFKDKPDMSLAEAEVLALSTLKQVMEEKVSVHVCNVGARGCKSGSAVAYRDPELEAKWQNGKKVQPQPCSWLPRLSRLGTAAGRARDDGERAG